jgi:hypothetical protein
MRLIITLPLLLFVLTAQSLAQSTCSLTLEQAPEVRGFKLGQEYEVVKKQIPEFEKAARVATPAEEKDELGARSWNLTGHLIMAGVDRTKYADWLKRMEGVAALKLTFLDDKLAAVAIAYDSSTVWNDPLEFTAAVAKTLKLPRQGWRGKSPTFLDCTGFTVETDTDYPGPQLVIKYRNLEGELVTRKYENQRKKREAFKP